MCGKGRKLVAGIVVSLTLLIVGAVPALAAETPHVAKCATNMGGTARCPVCSDDG
ncbi:MAG: hypothetical protein M1358_14410 [Chloroflexi bacterium]|nr:hypothetical protein [Chloroflexota bacterium]